jgi:sensor histidine kinase YesM
MTLQPLVENCIKHGLKNSIGRVVLNIQRFEKFIQISVSDNGSGFPAQIRDNIFARLVNSIPTRNIGCISRLMMKYMRLSHSILCSPKE